MGIAAPRIAATKTVNCVILNEEIVYDWSIQKTATPSNITFNFFGTDTVPVNYRITADRFVQSDIRNFAVSGSVCVSNFGNAPTTGLEITDEVQFRATPTGQFTTIAGPFMLTDLHELNPGEIACFPYEVAFFDQGPGEYRNVATVSITNGTAPITVTAGINVNDPDCTNLTEVDERATIESDQIIAQPGGFLPGAFIVFPPTGISFPLALEPVDTPQVFNYTRNIFKNILTFVEGDVVNQVTLVENDSGQVRQAQATVHINTIIFGLTGASAESLQNHLPLNVGGQTINSMEGLVEFGKRADAKQLEHLKKALNKIGLL